MSKTKVQRYTAVVVRDPYSREPKFFGRLAHCEDGEAVKFADYERDIAERDKTIADLRAELDCRVAEARAEGEATGLRRAADVVTKSAVEYVGIARDLDEKPQDEDAFYFGLAREQMDLVKLFRKMARKVKP